MDDFEANALIPLIAGGDEAAFSRLYKGLSRRVYAYVLHTAGAAADVDEIVVDTFHEVWKQAGRFRAESKVSTWILGIARNKWLMQIRSQRRHEHEDIDVFAEILPSDDADAVERIAEAERQEGMLHCLGKLSEVHRECLNLVFYQEYSVSEVAQLTQVPEGTVKTRLFHARQKIKQCVAKMLRDEGLALTALDTGDR